MPYEQFPDGTVKCIEDEIPFELPEGWEWCRLGFVFAHNTGKALNKSDTKGTSLAYITTSNLYWNKFEIDNLKTMFFTDAEIEKCTVKKGDLLVCEGGDIGRAAIWSYDEEICIQNHIHKLRPYVNINIKLYYYVFYYYKLIEMISGKGIGIQGLSSNQLHSIPIPIPPIREQNRIVTKLSELLSFIDTIESYKTDLLCAIQFAKEKILDLAIRGKLVPQDPSDEPASELLERIRAEKEELIRQKKIKRDKKETVIFRGVDNYPYMNIPKNWAVESFSELNIFQSSGINPLAFPDEYFELYSVPNYEFNTPEIVRGKEIGSTKQAVKNNDVLLCKINPRINRVWTVTQISKHRLIASSEWIVFRNPNLYAPYICLYLSSPFFRKILLTNVSGVGGSLMRAQPESVQKYPVIVPPLNEQKRIADRVSRLFSLLDYIAKNVE